MTTEEQNALCRMMGFKLIYHPSNSQSYKSYIQWGIRSLPNGMFWLGYGNTFEEVFNNACETVKKHPEWLRDGPAGEEQWKIN